MDIRVRNWWLTRSMKDCSSCLGGDDDDNMVIVVPRSSAGPSGYNMGDVVDVDRFVRFVYTTNTIINKLPQRTLNRIVRCHRTDFRLRIIEFLSQADYRIILPQGWYLTLAGRVGE